MPPFIYSPCTLSMNHPFEWHSFWWDSWFFPIPSLEYSTFPYSPLQYMYESSTWMAFFLVGFLVLFRSQSLLSIFPFLLLPLALYVWIIRFNDIISGRILHSFPFSALIFHPKHISPFLIPPLLYVWIIRLNGILSGGILGSFPFPALISDLCPHMNELN